MEKQAISKLSPHTLMFRKKEVVWLGHLYTSNQTVETKYMAYYIT